MPEVIIKDNIKEFTRFLSRVEKKQVPFATSRAINDTAVDAQKSIQAAIPHIFDNRKKWWLKQQPTGIKIKFSNKTRLTASIFTNAPFAELQEKGGIKTPKSGGVIAVPTAKVAKRYRKAGGARQLLQSSDKIFSTKKGIFKKRGKSSITTMFVYTKTANVRRRFGFARIAEKVVKRKFNRNFATRLQQALRTAR